MTITSTIGSAAGRTYSTLQAWADAIPATLADNYVGLAYNDSEFTGTLAITGKTTTATFNIALKCAVGQSFYDNPNKLTNALRYNVANGVGLRTTSGSLVTSLNINNNYTTLDGFQVQVDHGSSTGCITVTGTGSQIRNCISHCTALNTNGAGSSINDPATGYNIVHIQESSNGNGLVIATNGKVEFLTAINASGTVFATAFNNGYGNPIVNNLVGVGWTAFSRGSTYPFGAGSNYDATDLPPGSWAGPGANNVYGIIAANTFVSVTKGSVDARIKAGAAVINAGGPDTAFSGTTDIVGTTRSATTPTIGAWEFAAGSTVTGTGSAAGTSTAAATGAATAKSGATSAGTSTASATGAATAATTGTAAGTSTAPAVGTAIATSTGTAAGTSTASAGGAATSAATGTASGTSTATGAGASKAAATATAAGSSTASGVGASTATAVGTSAGTSAASGTGASSAASAGVGSAAGLSTAAATGASVVASVGIAAGTSNVVAVSFGQGASAMRRLQAQRLEVMAHYERIIAEREKRKEAEALAKPVETVKPVKQVKVVKPPTQKKVVAAVRAAMPVAQPLPAVQIDPHPLVQQLQLTAFLQHTARLVQAQRDAEQQIRDIDRQIQVKRQQDDVEIVLLLAA